MQYTVVWFHSVELACWCRVLNWDLGGNLELTPRLNASSCLARTLALAAVYAPQGRHGFPSGNRVLHADLIGVVEIGLDEVGHEP